MVYKTITNQLLDYISQARKIIEDIHLTNKLIRENSSIKEESVKRIESLHKEWYAKCQEFLIESGLLLEQEEFNTYNALARSISNFDKQLNPILNFVIDRKRILIGFAKEIEKKQNKEIVILKIDDFDNFKDVKKIKSTDVTDYCKDCFLEDDIENVFLENLEEPYKEPDGGYETRDLFSDRMIYDGKRLSTAFMFKGRGEKGELTIKKSGSTGNQLLKLAKNNSAECFVVQHTHKINPDVREALQDHILQNTRLSKVYVCFVDGIDTARFLKSMGKNLEELKNKKG